MSERQHVALSMLHCNCGREIVRQHMWPYCGALHVRPEPASALFHCAHLRVHDLHRHAQLAVHTRRLLRASHTRSRFSHKHCMHMLLCVVAVVR